MNPNKYGFNYMGAFRVGTERIMIRAPFTLLHKHYCSQCHNILKIAWITQLIYEGTPESIGKDLHFGFKGKPVQYTFAIFVCAKCGNKLSINDQYFYEKPHKIKDYEVKYGDYKLIDDYHSYVKYNEKRST